MASRTFKIILTGDGGVGKTTFVKRLMTGEFERKYNATLGVDVRPLQFDTTYGHIILDIWDTAGQQKFTGLKDEYAIGADAVMGMCDVSQPGSLKHLDAWYKCMVTPTSRYMKQSSGGMRLITVPTVACCNKVDLINNATNAQKADLKNKWGECYDISAKSNYNFEKPFLYLMRELTGFKDLKILCRRKKMMA